MGNHCSEKTVKIWWLFNVALNTQPLLHKINFIPLQTSRPKHSSVRILQ
jgi:hypothetical protein